MPALKPHRESGRLLKEERIRVRLSTREVERLSQKIAHEKNNQEYYISHGWLSEVENGEFAPSIYKLYSLSLIYKRRINEILAFFGINIGNIAHEQISLTLPHTHLITDSSESGGQSSEIPAELHNRILLEKTNLVSHMFNQWGGLPAPLLQHMDLGHSLYGYVGMRDLTLFPIIRPGSFVEIDARQRKVDRASWSNEFDRPIYFVELRDEYACSWCEVKDGKLLLVPYPHARNQVRQVRFPGDAGILGRVTAVSMRLAEIHPG